MSAYDVLKFRVLTHSAASGFWEDETRAQIERRELGQRDESWVDDREGKP